VSAVGPATIAAANPRGRILVGMAALAAAAGAAAVQPRPASGVVAAFVAAVVVIIAAIDFRRRLIPNRIVLPATAAVLVAHAAVSPGHAWQLVAASGLAGLALLGLNVVTRSGIGMGDVKFALLIGAAVGPTAVGAITLGFLAIFPVALFVLIRGGLSARKAWLPFGPFLALGTLIMLITAPGAVA
jgi:leader peptidase (prepilin peptidase) / N-methyltransferase